MIKFKIAIMMLMMICFQSMTAQNITLKGVVNDVSGLPMAGATVLEVGTSNGTTTDFDGNYSLSKLSTSSQLIFSYIGMISQTVTVGNQKTINISLQESLEALNEIVVVGYGKQNRASVTGAISTVKSEEIIVIPVANPEEALQGRAAGVTVVNTGSPGSNPVVRIRGLGTFGNNTPLYVVDGVIVGGLSSVSQNDIETINILKDASTTAVYGAQGSNGVVMITTKKGKPGQIKVEFNSYAGVQNNSERYDVLNTRQYLQYASEAFNFIPNTPSVASGNNTNWQDEIFTNGAIRNYDFAISGGGENSNVRFSGGYLQKEGIIIETGFEKYSFRLNSDFKTGKFKFGQTMSLSFNKQRPELSNGGRSLIEHAIKAAPYLSVYNPANLGGFQGPNSAGDGQDAENAVRIMQLGNATNRTFGLIGSMYGEYEVFEGLTFRSQVGLDYFSTNNNRFVPSYNDDSLGQTHSQAFAQINKNFGLGQVLIFTNSLNYNKTFNDVHNFEILVLAEKYKSQFEGTGASSRNEITDEVENLSDNLSSLASGSSEYNRLGYLGRLNYDFDNRYIVAASIRRDASSRFGAKNRWGTFYSVAAGWNIARESFMENSAFSTLKLRGSYGTSGNDKIGDYEYSATLVSDFIYPIGTGAAVGTTAFGLPNPNLKWEETKQLNVGLDVGLFNEKFTAAFEYYQNRSDDLLLAVSTPTSSGINSGFVRQNVGSVETKGFEVSLGYRDFEGDFTWSANVNVGTSKNEALSLGGVLGELVGGNFETENITRVVEGESLFHFYGLVTDGIYQNQAEVDAVFTANPGQTTVQPGDIRFKDLNGDGDITAEDKAIIGNPFPDITYGFNLDAAYKNFDLNIFIAGVAGRDVYDTNIYDLEGMSRLFNSGTAVLDRWTPTNPSTTIPRAGGAPQNLSVSDRFVEDGSFTRLKNISLGYTIPKNTFGANSISSLRFYISGQNLITLTKYSGLDPEVGNGDSFEFGIDRGLYPQPKSVLIGLQATF